MALHENYRDYTRKELNQIIRDNCMARNCPYLSGLSSINNSKKGHEMYINKCCMYIVRARKMRNCMPDECEHWKDKIKIKRSDDLDEC